ncbi:hypothetical protein L6Q79_08790 [bacterium]|nr:hypothetical protein [bacterium]
MKRNLMLGITAALFIASCTKTELPTMNTIAEHYVRLILKIGLHDGDYVDAYYGPDSLKPKSDAALLKTEYPLTVLLTECDQLLAQLAQIKPDPKQRMDGLRHTYLIKQLTAARTKIEMLNGKKYSFDEESRLLYDAVAPTYDSTHFRAILTELEQKMPGHGNLTDRLEEFRKAFIIPKDKLDVVFQAAIKEGRRRTQQYIPLPEKENFTVEYVNNKPWSGYNWYKGGAYSLIQVNTDLPIFIDRAVDLACHEGYPGHHVYNALLEKTLVRDRGWIEFTVYPLFSPQSLIAEGSANYGIEMALPGAERMKFEKEVLFPLAGIDAKRVDEYYAVQALVGKISYAGNEAARGFINGTMTREQAIDWMVTYGMYARERAEQRLRFIERYRSYVINYNYGLDLVRGYIEKNGGTSDKPETRWKLFEKLLSEPTMPSALQ